MEERNLRSLVVKHFNFLQENHGLKYDNSSNRYFNEKFELKFLHENAKLNLILIIDKKKIQFSDMMSHILGKKFTYPEHFSAWIVSMGDVDSRLSYDAKLMRENINEFIK